MRQPHPLVPVAALLLLLAACATQPGPASTNHPAPYGLDADFARPVSTYSIVARDAATGEMGVAVQSHWFSVGAVVPWAEAGVGAVATQSLVKVSYGPLGLALMRDGKSAPEALDALRADDTSPEIRQVAMIDAQGRVGSFTGSRCIAEAGDARGIAPDGSAYSAQANLMKNKTVPGAMARAFEKAPVGTPLAERLLAALKAAQAEGGDIRGKQSAAILTVSAEKSDQAWEGRLVDLRVEDAPDPLAELERLLRLQRAYDRMNQGDLAMEKQDIDGALQAYGAARALAPESAEMVFWTAVSLVGAGKADAAIPLFAEAFKDPHGDWRETLRRLPAAGLLPDDPSLMQRLLAAGR